MAFLRRDAAHAASATSIEYSLGESAPTYIYVRTHTAVVVSCKKGGGLIMSVLIMVMNGKETIVGRFLSCTQGRFCGSTRDVS